MRAQEGPGVSDVFFSLLKGDLLSDGIGLISHLFLWLFVGVVVGSVLDVVVSGT